MSFADCIQATEIYDEQPSQLPQQLLSEETQGFDYTILTPEVRVVVWSKTFELKNLMRQSAQDRIEIGQKLIEIKEKLGHGNFRPWLKAEFGWSMRTAARFMQVASQFKCANLAHLDIAASALYLLAEPSTPEEARKEVFELAKEGENITYSKAKAIISRYQKPAQPNASKPDSINAIDTTFAKAKEGNSSTLFESCSSPQNYSQSQALEPKDKGNSMVVTELLVETLTAKECEKRLEPGTIENINSLKKHSEVAAELQPELSNSIRVISIEKKLDLATSIAQTFDLTFAGIHVNFEGNPKELLILFEQMLNNPAFAKEVLQQARTLAGFTQCAIFSNENPVVLQK